MKLLKSLVASVVLLAAASTAMAQQFIPMLSYRVGPYAAGGSGFYGGIIDYMTLVNMRDNGINGVKLI